MFGIDKLTFYTSDYFLALATLARRHSMDIDLQEQSKMAVIPPNEDVVTLGSNAAYSLLTEEDRGQVGLLIFATESSCEMAKSAASYLHAFLNLPAHCRIIELKQACYAATFGIHIGMNWLAQNSRAKVLVVASDIAKYTPGSRAEASQGGGAVAMLLSEKPKLLSVEAGAGCYTKETMDFWHPNYLEDALVDGRLSCETYLKLLIGAWENYLEVSKRSFGEHGYFCFHTPVVRLVRAGYQRLLRQQSLKEGDFERQVGFSLQYSRVVGNCYTASLYLGLLSLLENGPLIKPQELIGLYSYGSGSIGEFYAMRVVAGYHEGLGEHGKRLAERQELTYADYLKIRQVGANLGGGKFEGTLPNDFISRGPFYLKAIRDNRREYAAR